MCSRRATLESFRPYHDSISSISNSVRASKLRGFAAVLAEVETFTNSQDEVFFLCETRRGFVSRAAIYYRCSISQSGPS